jgi:hypothetical protein
VIILGQSGYYFRLACQSCEAHTIVWRDSLDRGGRPTCPVCCATEPVRRSGAGARAV